MKVTYRENKQKMQSGLYKSEYTENIYLYNREENAGVLVFTNKGRVLGTIHTRFSYASHMMPFNGTVTISS